MRIVRLDERYYPGGQYGHWCPACNSGHEINVDTPNSNGAKWTFDGNMEQPSFSPSVNLRWGNKVPGHEATRCGGVCHYFITAGNIVYCGDCTHAMAGKTVPMIDLPPGTYSTSQYRARTGVLPGDA